MIRQVSRQISTEVLPDAKLGRLRCESQTTTRTSELQAMKRISCVGIDSFEVPQRNLEQQSTARFQLESLQTLEHKNNAEKAFRHSGPILSIFLSFASQYVLGTLLGSCILRYLRSVASISPVPFYGMELLFLPLLLICTWQALAGHVWPVASILTVWDASGLAYT